MPTTTPLVSLHQVTVRYGDHEALSNVDMELYPGQIVTLVGPNGAGKCTLARVVLGSIKRGHGGLSVPNRHRGGANWSWPIHLGARGAWQHNATQRQHKTKEKMTHWLHASEH